MLLTLIAFDKRVSSETTWTLAYSSVVLDLAFCTGCTGIRHSAWIDALSVEASVTLRAVIIALATWFLNCNIHNT
jgi:hypothetical protein